MSRPALPRPRPFERDLDDDEWDRSDGEQFRRRGAWFMASARTKVAGPANGLFAVGLINLALSGFYVIINTGNGAAFFKNQDVDPLVINLVVNAIRIALSIFTVIAAQKMKKLQSLRMVKAAAILTMIPFVSPCCILGLVFGIQAMNVLGDADIGRAFARQATNPDSEF